MMLKLSTKVRGSKFFFVEIYLRVWDDVREDCTTKRAGNCVGEGTEVEGYFRYLETTVRDEKWLISLRTATTHSQFRTPGTLN